MKGSGELQMRSRFLACLALFLVLFLAVQAVAETLPDAVSPAALEETPAPGAETDLTGTLLPEATEDPFPFIIRYGSRAACSLVSFPAAYKFAVIFAPVG